MNAILRAVAFVVLMAVLIAAVVARSATTTAPSVRKEDLPRVPPTEPRDALKTFKVRPGFHVELAASEPNVMSPIALCFDGNGRMFVVEMRDYSERRAEKLGRIRMLEDADGDGVYEKSTVFLDHLPWPTGVMCVNGGVLVGACPDIIFAKDTDGDGVADQTKILFTGFGTEEKLNVQGLFNNFQWGLDNHIHGCSGHDGGMVRQALHPDRPPLDVRNKGFVIDPRDWSMTVESGGGQYGLCFDPAGRLFTCTNSSHCEVFMFDAERYAARNPYAQLPDPRINIAVDGPAAEVFRISPEEPWRVIRTRWRVAGLVPGPVEGGGRSAGYFTGATGITIYKGDAFGPDYVGDAFIGDAGGNLVHHKHITPGPDGIEPVAARPADEKQIEFVASTDNWFRPVDFANAPDGCLYIVDMYREVIEHPWSLPPAIKQFLDLNSGWDRGRIYRLAPDGFDRKRRDPGLPPRLEGASNVELIKLLANPNGWHRETAARLLFERQDFSVAPLLRSLLNDSTSAPLGRVYAMHVLEGLGALSEPNLVTALADSDPIVRTHAVKLAELHPSDHVATALLKLSDDPDARVRYQLAFTLGSFKGADAADTVAALSSIAARDVGSKWVRAAVLSSLSYGAAEVYAKLAGDQGFSNRAEGRQFLVDLGRMIGARNRTDEIQTVLKSSPVRGVWELRRALADGIAGSAGVKAVRTRLGEMLTDARQVATDSSAASAASAPSAERTAAIALLGYQDWSDVSQTLDELLGDSRESVQVATLSALDRFEGSDAPSLIVSHFTSLTPRARADGAAVLLKRPERATLLLHAIEAHTLKQSNLDAAQVNQLLASHDASVRTLARSLLKAPSTIRSDVVESFRPALSLTGDARHGKLLYEQRCISCHRAMNEGSLVGPDFVTLRNAGREKLLLNILDPSREVQPQYVAYVVETKDGQSLLGILASDTPANVTVRQAYGKDVVVDRANIARMTSQGKSLMPDGLEAGMKPQDVADLIAFAESVK